MWASLAPGTAEAAVLHNKDMQIVILYLSHVIIALSTLKPPTAYNNEIQQFQKKTETKLS